MKKIVVILMVGFLGFLGCSDGGGGTSTFTGEAIPVAPFGISGTPTPTYEWIPVQRATKYRLLVQDSSQTTVIEEWYTANELESATEGGLCKVTPDNEVFEENTWKVQACANDECGLWSELLPFDVTAMNGPRWTDNGDNTVLDHTTGIIWAKQTGELDKNGQYPILVRYKRAWHHCNSLNAGERKGWRLPTAWELESVLTELTFELCVDPPPNQFHIPYDHGDIEYWTHNKGEAGGAKWAVIDILS